MAWRSWISLVVACVWVLSQTAMAYAQHTIGHGTAASAVQSTMESGHSSAHGSAMSHDHTQAAPDADHRADHGSASHDSNHCAMACSSVLVPDLEGVLQPSASLILYELEDRTALPVAHILPNPPPNTLV